MYRTVFNTAVITVILASVGPVRVSATDTDPGEPQLDIQSRPDSPGQHPFLKSHLEVPDDPYIPVPRSARKTSPAAQWERNGYISVQVNVDGDGNNIIGDAANEPSIAVDPTDSNRMAIGWRQFDTILSNFRQAGWGYTSDRGQSWTFPGVIEPGVFRSDPVLDFDADGNFFYSSLSADSLLNDFWVNIFKSTNGGTSWDDGVYAYGGDKQWMTIDRTGGVGRGNIYQAWNWAYSSCDGLFTLSYDGGQTFPGCMYVPNWPFYATLTVGPDGELYIGGGNSFGGTNFVVVRSSTIQDQSLPVHFDFASVVDLDGVTRQGGPNPTGLLGQAWVAVDHSEGSSRGNVYLLCSVLRNSTTDPLDVMFARSLDGGWTWSDPIRVNDDPEGNGAWQWFGTMSVAPTGRIDVIWNDTRNDPGGYDSELYYAYSNDAGQTWSKNTPVSPAFNPHVGWPSQQKLGDYYDMVSERTGAHVAYAATFNGGQDVYYVYVHPKCEDAGTISLHRAAYRCEDTVEIAVMDCGLNTDDGIVDSVTINIDSDSEAGVEQMTLTETGLATGRFEGSINLSTIDSPGVLMVAEGDMVTARYIDADDGIGGTNIDVTDSAPVDCTPPIIANVQTTDIAWFDARTTFDTNEPARGSVRFGRSCDGLTKSDFLNSCEVYHSFGLRGLDDNDTCYYIVYAEDDAGNMASDDNGGACYSFTTPQAGEYFTEFFDFSVSDLAYHALRFTPNGSDDFYQACVHSINALPTDPDGGIQLVLSSDSSVLVYLISSKTVWLYGVEYDRFYVGSNGYITFGRDTASVPLIEYHFGRPRISGLFANLDPSAGGTVSSKQFLDRVAVTYQNVPSAGNEDSNTFQIEMYFDGTIVFSYLGVDASYSLAGLSAGGGVPGDFGETDLTAMPGCIEPPAVPTWGHDTRKNRYISFAPNNPYTAAFEVQITASAEFPTAAGVLGWVGTPQQVGDQDWVSRVVPSPVFRPWTEWVIHVGDCEIVPAATYEIRGTSDGTFFSAPLELGTIHKPGERFYGDTVGVAQSNPPPPWLPFTPPNGVVNVTDIQAFILTFQGPSSPSAHTTWVDLHGDGPGSPPNFILNVSDLQRIKFGFQGWQYQDSPDQINPAGCP